jgi:hypothetical protein
VSGPLAQGLEVLGLYGRARVGLRTDPRFEAVDKDIARALIEQGYAESVGSPRDVIVGGEITITLKGREATGR